MGRRFDPDRAHFGLSNKRLIRLAGDFGKLPIFLCLTSHNQLNEIVQHLGPRLGSTFVDGGFHPVLQLVTSRSGCKMITTSKLYAH